MSVSPTHGGNGNGFHGNCVYGDGGDGGNINGIRVKANGVYGIGDNGNGVEPGETGHAPQPPCFSLVTLLHDLQPHAELDLGTLAYHLQQSDATAADGYCHAAINEARSFLEALVVNIVHAAQRDARNRDADDGAPNAGCNGIRSGGRNGTAFRHYRKYLLDIGLIDLDENELLQFVYSVASAKGSHPGVTDELWTRLARRIVFAAGQYVVQRYAAWKHNSGHVASPADKPTPPRRRWLASRRWLARLIATRRREKKVSG